MTPELELAVVDLIGHISNAVDAGKKRIYSNPNNPPPAHTVTLEEGKRYIRIVYSEGESHRSVYGFIDTTNGDLLKAASWKAPAKHARGNIFQKDTWRCCGPYGMAYLR